MQVGVLLKQHQWKGREKEGRGEEEKEGNRIGQMDKWKAELSWSLHGNFGEAC